ncbi:MAG: NAD(P)H-hydrate dehydratase [Dehalococcoidales bacterium]|nr:NAD(P)H-hydrate dehydratase [Dehalococcoidales bacterium]
MLLIAGTVPVPNMPLTFGVTSFKGDDLMVNSKLIPCTQGTGAMVSAALKTTSYLGVEAPCVLLAGDMGKGEGSRGIYEYLIENLPKLMSQTLALHYCLPDITLMKRLSAVLDDCSPRPALIADAGSMYAAKVAGLAPKFDVFTPDAAELAFLADPTAPHPAYVKFMAHHNTAEIPQLIKTAYASKSAAPLMLVKGAVDYIVRDGVVIETVTEPDVPAMECIGGTGDTITGMVAAFIAAGLEPREAAILAARSNRMAGQMASVKPASRVGAVVAELPAVFKKYLCSWSGVCINKGVKS